MKATSKFLSLILRHKPQIVGIELDEHGWADVDELIRANQGHSVPVDVELEELAPPEILYHGTGEKFSASIKIHGLLKKSRLYVHLSGDIDTAQKVGRRHGVPKIFLVESGKMFVDGFKFFRSVNGVWLTEHVPAKYLKESF